MHRVVSQRHLVFELYVYTWRVYTGNLASTFELADLQSTPCQATPVPGSQAVLSAAVLLDCGAGALYAAVSASS